MSMSGGRPRHDIGSVGKVWVEKNAKGVWVAKAWRRGLDGRRRQVSASGATKGVASRALQRKLDEPMVRAGLGVSASWSVEELAAHWLQRKGRVGKSGSAAPVKGQTLGTYAASIEHLIVPWLGGVRVHELTAAMIENVLSTVEANEISTEGARTVLGQMMKLALRDGALTHNPMTGVAPSARAPKPVRAMSVEQAREHLALLDPENRVSGKRTNRARLFDLAVFGLGTGARLGELLAIRWCDLDLDPACPTVHINGTVVEPRKGFVEKHHRQESTKTEEDRLLVLPDAVVQAAQRRREAQPNAPSDAAVFPGANGAWEWQANIRTQLKVASADHFLAWVRPHDWRRTVGTHLAYQVDIPAAQLQLGHTITSGAIGRYVEVRRARPDLRYVLDAFFVDPVMEGAAATP